MFEGTSSELRFDGSGTLLKVLDRITEVAAPPVVVPATRAADVDGEEDLAPTSASPEVEALVAAADPERKDASGGPDVEPRDAARAPAPDVAQLMSALTVERGPDGRVRIEAPPEAASALVALFAGMARLLTPARDTVAPAPAEPRVQ